MTLQTNVDFRLLDDFSVSSVFDLYFQFLILHICLYKVPPSVFGHPLSLSL
jgi:hypothetical protein